MRVHFSLQKIFFCWASVDSCRPNCALESTVMDIIKCVINNINFSVDRLSCARRFIYIFRYLYGLLYFMQTHSKTKIHTYKRPSATCANTCIDIAGRCWYVVYTHVDCRKPVRVTDKENERDRDGLGKSLLFSAFSSMVFNFTFSQAWIVVLELGVLQFFARFCHIFFPCWWRWWCCLLVASSTFRVIQCGFSQM